VDVAFFPLTSFVVYCIMFKNWEGGTHRTHTHTGLRALEVVIRENVTLQLHCPQTMTKKQFYTFPPDLVISTRRAVFTTLSSSVLHLVCFRINILTATDFSE